jgi:hypothetical protein
LARESGKYSLHSQNRRRLRNRCGSKQANSPEAIWFSCLRFCSLFPHL